MQKFESELALLVYQIKQIFFLSSYPSSFWFESHVEFTFELVSYVEIFPAIFLGTCFITRQRQRNMLLLLLLNMLL